MNNPPLTAEPTSASNDPLAIASARWRAIVDAELKGVPFEKKLVTRTLDGLVLQPLYTRADTAKIATNEIPGAAPYRRGVRPLGYRDARWEFAQEFAVATAAEFNAALVPDLMHGQTAVVLTPDVATRSGSDPDEASAADVGAGGVSLADVSDVTAALNGVDLQVPVHIAAGGDASPMAALYLETARRRGVNWTGLNGSLTADPIGEWVSRGTLPTSLDALLGSLAGWTGWAATSVPGLRTIGVDASIWGNAGATVTQEVAFALATAVEYLREVAKRGVAIETAIERLAFRFAIGPQFFTEVAKLRAFRPLLTRVAVGFKAAPEAAAAATVAAATGAWNKTRLDPHVNMLRVTTEALSAVLGACDRLHIAPFDEVSGGTSDFSRRIARNVHTLLAEEFGFAQTADPSGGSWYVEKLTDEVARAAWALFQDIEGRGGMIAALRSGYPQQLVEKAALEKRDAVAKRRIGIVGTNLFPNLKETPLAEANIDRAARQSVRASEIRSRRGNSRIQVSATADWPTRFAAALAAARDGATVGQLSRLSIGEKAPNEVIVAATPQRAGAAFETLRAASTALAERGGARPKVFLAKMGPALQHKARADFSAGFFAVGGFEIMAKQTFATAEEAVAAAAKAKADVVVLCSTDETYPALVPAFAPAVRAGLPKATIVLAGLPADAAVVTAFRAAGVDEFIHVRANVYDVLAGLLKKMGAL